MFDSLFLIRVSKINVDLCNFLFLWVTASISLVDLNARRLTRLGITNAKEDEKEGDFDLTLLTYKDGGMDGHC